MDNVEQIAPPVFKKHTSLVVKISILYLMLTLVNGVLFWAAVGANQMRLIKSNTLLSSKSVAGDILQQVQGLVQDPAWASAVTGIAQGGAERVAAGKLLQEKLEASRATLQLSKFQIISALGEDLLETAAGGAQVIVGKDTYSKVLAALQLKEQKNQTYYGSMNLLNYSVELYIPLTSTGASDLVLFTEVPVPSIRAELRSLLILGIAMIALLTVIQSLFGYLLYRMLIIPLHSLLKGAAQIAAGDFTTGIAIGKKNDELGHLIFLFNEMASSLDQKTTGLN